ncbi:ATP-binding protein [candidate division WOR-3 bacterium]|uniref:ATP-binding protein n=1 Tax=candidate division WOR-3 bacterium TaxID=2052148 RepID=A0A937XGP5_UNCW3|nr:ATP-binding protein [candidate division WOR-3 bacterium]
MTGYVPREIAPRLARARRQLPVVVLSGLRQSGKSTLLQNEAVLIRGYAYRTLDDFATLAAARSNPESLLAEPAILDEVQRCPELLVALKKNVDEHRRPGRFILSGSANLALLGHVSETLAGRAAYFTLHPMTQREIRGETGDRPFLADFLASPEAPHGRARSVTDGEVLTGGLPPAALSPAGEVAEWFRGYVQTYVERDVRQLSQVGDLVAFRNLAQLAALRTGQMLVMSSLGRDARLNAATVSRYLGLLEASFLVRRLPAFRRNRSSRLVKSPKLHFTDSGLAAHLAGATALDPGRDDLLRGALFEAYVAQNVAALLEVHLPDAQLSYWHEHGRHEVDLVVEHNREVVAIEVKAATRWNEKDLSGLRAFLDRTPDCRAAVLAYNGNEAVKLDERLWAIPMGHLLA